MNHWGILIFLIALQTSHCGRYTPPSDPREYDFKYTRRTPTVDEMIKDANFDYEHHPVITPDGHILSLNRISPRNIGYSRRGIPVLFISGFCFQSESWMLLGRNTSLAFILSDLGYDVWLGDVRGSTRSLGHANYSSSDPRVHQYNGATMGTQDVPTFINHILKLTKHDRLFYVGHSMAAAIFVAMASEMPEMSDKIVGAVFIGPGIKVTRLRERNFYFSTMLRTFNSMIDWQMKRKIWLIFGNINFVRAMITSCNYVPLSLYSSTCLTSWTMLIGPFTGNTNEATYSLQLATAFTSSSVFVAKHLYQVLDTGDLSYYDFGDRKMNMKMYGALSPPKFDYTKVITPLLVIYSADDGLTHFKGVERSIEALSSAPKEIIRLSGFSHVDYLYGRKAPEKVYAPIVDFLDKMSGNNIST